MLKKILFLIFIFISIISKSYAEIIQNVDIKGNKRITNETIILFGNIKVGEIYEDRRLNQIIKNLYNTNFFETISIKVLNNTMYLDVVENPIIQLIQIDGVKNKNLSLIHI